MEGTRLGPYEIVEPLGAGGMGEVWLARDTRLGRQVAIKVLPEEFASDPERLARFEQEARAAAALNHPHIAAVYDVGSEKTEDGTTTRFMVQEYLTGEPLRALLDKGRLPLGRALELATEITEALTAAHRAGIVHRDLKPDNVFVAEDGHAKVLDFGLAKLTELEAGPAGDQSMSPTVLGTQAGAIMGTAGYMAPEQVNGVDVDARADIFAFGCLLYEMASGKRAFAGNSLIQTLNRIAHEEPEPLGSLDGSLPAELQRIVRKCLAKSPTRRYQTAADLTVDLLALGADLEAGRVAIGPAPERATEAAPRGRFGAGVLAAGVALALLAGAALGWALLPAPSPPAEGPVRFTIELPEGLSDFSNRNQRVLAISPDGRHVAFVADDRLWLRAFDEPEALPLRGTEEPRSPTFSPDGTQLAFWSDDQIRRMNLSGGLPVPVGPLEGRPQGVSWGADGFLYAGSSDARRLVRFPETGGQPEVVVEAEVEGDALYGPRLLPGGEWLVYTAAADRNWEAGRIVARSLDGGAERVLIEGGHDARYVPTGHLLYVSGGTLFAVRLDPRSLETSGGPIPLIEGVRGAGLSGAAYYSVSNRGHLVYVIGSSSSELRLAWVDRDGEVIYMPLEGARYTSSMALSRDGRRLAIGVDEEPEFHVWVYDADRPGGQRLTGEGNSDEPVWSPDGDWIYFMKQTGEADIWRRRADLGGPEEPVLEAAQRQWPGSISADGEWLYYVQAGQEPPDIYRVNLISPADPEPIVTSPAVEIRPRISPDGRFLLFESDETGEFQVFALEIDSGRRWRISDTLGGASAWSRASRQILYANYSGLYAVDYELEPDFDPAPPVRLRGQPDASAPSELTLTDDLRAVVRMDTLGLDEEGDRTPRIQVVLNWFEELLERAPVQR